MNSNQPPPGLPTTDQINRILVDSGEAARLKSLLKVRLQEAGWHEQMRTECFAEIRKRGVDKTDPVELASWLETKGKAAVPDAVREAVMREVGAFLDRIIVTE